MPLVSDRLFLPPLVHAQSATMTAADSIWNRRVGMGSPLDDMATGKTWTGAVGMAVAAALRPMV
jgi:hypothetical protein